MVLSPYESSHHRAILDALSGLFLSFPNTQQERRRYGLRRRFPNGMRCDAICGEDDVLILRVSRGARMIRHEPRLAGLFDVNLKVISKIFLPTLQSIEDKVIPALAKKIYELPKGISVMDR